jgi:hypothetical protein
LISSPKALSSAGQLTGASDLENVDQINACLRGKEKG